MLKGSFALAVLCAVAGPVLSQDMPPLPPMTDQTVSAGGTAALPGDATALPPLPASSSSSAAPMPPLPDSSAGSPVPSLPPLPSSSAPAAPAANSSAPGLPPLPSSSAAPSNSSAPALPPLPSSSAPSASGSPAAGMPPLPGQTPAADQAAAPAAPAEGTPAPKKVKAAPKAERPWEATKWRPNVIFGGWVLAKGGNETSRLAWTAQEVMDALCFKGYRVLKEDGKYPGQSEAGGHQWREITFSVPKSKLRVQVFAKQTGKRVWLRVGPSEPPAFAETENSIAHVGKMREANLKALHLIQKRMGRRLLPHQIIRSYEAPYSFAKDTVVE